MELRVVREFYMPDCTVGRLLVNGQFECYTLEDGIRTNKVAGDTAIPAGRYPVTITYSNAFRRELPLIEGVRNFTGVRIHSGNTNKDTLGCVLVGQTWTPGQAVIGSSVRAMQALLPKIRTALDAGEAVSLSIEQPNAPPELASRDLRPPIGGRRRKPAASVARASKRGTGVGKAKQSPATARPRDAAAKRAAAGRVAGARARPGAKPSTKAKRRRT